MSRQETKTSFGPSAKQRTPLSREERAQRRQLLVYAGFASLALAILLTPDLLPTGVGAARLPEAGRPAERSYKAPFDISIVDEDATQEHRRKAEEQAPAIYDFDERRASKTREQLVAAFNAARALIAQGPATEAAAAQPVDAVRNALVEDLVISKLALEHLKATGFDSTQQGLVLQLTAPILARKIVDDAPEFERQVAKRNVRVRELGSASEYPLISKNEVLSLDQAYEQVRSQADRVLEQRPRKEREALLELSKVLVRPNLSVNLRATEERRQAVVASEKDVVISLRKGEIIVRDGDTVTERHVLILHGIRTQERATSRAERFLGVAALLFVLFATAWRFGASGFGRFARQPKDAAFLLTTLVLAAIGTGLGVFLCDAVSETPQLEPILEQEPRTLYYVIPFAAATMLVRLVHSAETAVLFAVLVALLTGLQIRGEVTFSFYALAGSLTAAFATARVTQRGTLLRAGVTVGAVNMAVIAALTLLEGRIQPGPLALAMFLGFVGGAMSGGLVLMFAPVVEGLFSYTTDVKLLEMANREQFLLRELEFRAPGTYHHSMMVGHLAEKAAEAIGANQLLAKVAGYYHDIGKMRRPHFFVENVTIHRGENRHEKLSPSMSARIIQAHVKDGLEFGEQYKLAPPIMRGIAEHHGTSVIRFFFEKAKEFADPEKGELVAEHDYRYPGPKPQTREAGLLMLADSVEAASRTLSDVSRARVQQLVQRIINNYFRDGQLDECSLTLRDLHAIARSFIDTLSAIRHERIDYPEATGPDGRKLEEDVDEGLVERLEPAAKDRPEGPAEGREGGLKRLGLP